MYERCGMSLCANGVRCEVVEWVKRNRLKWFGHVHRMGSGEFVEVCGNESESPNRRGRSLGKWKDRAEYVSESDVSGRGVLEKAKRECWEEWRLLDIFKKGF